MNDFPLYRLKRRDIAPPGGFTAKAETGATFSGDIFTDVETRLSRHLKANGCLPQDAAEMIDLQTAERLVKDGLKANWCEMI